MAPVKGTTSSPPAGRVSGTPTRGGRGRGRGANQTAIETPAAPPPNYDEEVRTLQEMGFLMDRASLEGVLAAANGNVARAIEFLS